MQTCQRQMVCCLMLWRCQPHVFWGPALTGPQIYACPDRSGGASRCGPCLCLDPYLCRAHACWRVCPRSPPPVDCACDLRDLHLWGTCTVRRMGSQHSARGRAGHDRLQATCCHLQQAACEGADACHLVCHLHSQVGIQQGACRLSASIAATWHLWMETAQAGRLWPRGCTACCRFGSGDAGLHACS